MPLVICPGDYNAEYLNVKRTKLGHLLENEQNKFPNIDPFIAIFLDGKYNSNDLVSIKNRINKFCQINDIEVKPESSPRSVSYTHLTLPTSCCV